MMMQFDLVCVECFQMIELIVVVLMSQQCGKFTRGEYSLSSIGNQLYSTIGKGFQNKIVLHSFREVKCNQAYIAGTFHEVYKILGLPILMTVSSLVVSYEDYNRGSPSLFPYSFKCLLFNSDIE